MSHLHHFRETHGLGKHEVPLGHLDGHGFSSRVEGRPPFPSSFLVRKELDDLNLACSTGRRGERPARVTVTNDILTGIPN